MFYKLKNIQIEYSFMFNKMEYAFIAITSRSTLTLSCSNF